MGSRIPSHQLSDGLYVSGRPEHHKERQPTIVSRAIPYTGGDVKKSGELGKMFDIPVSDHPPPLLKFHRASSSSQHSSGTFRSGSNSDFGPIPKQTPSPINARGNGEQQEDEHKQADEDEDEDVRLDEGYDINQGLMQRSLPTNALLLMRCRSAPYRSSSLGSIFHESTMVKTSESEVAEELKDLKIESTKVKLGGDEVAEGLKNLSVRSTMVKTGEEDIAEELKNLKVELTMGKKRKLKF